MAKMVKKSPIPIYLGAAVWVLWGLFLPLYRLSDILLTAGACCLAIAVGKLIFPNQTYETPEAKTEAPKAEEKKQQETTGNADIDALIAEGDKAVSEIKRLNANIPDEKLSKQKIGRASCRERVCLYV